MSAAEPAIDDVVEAILGGQSLRKWLEDGWPHAPALHRGIAIGTLTELDTAAIPAMVRQANADGGRNLLVLRNGKTAADALTRIQVQSQEAAFTWPQLLEALGSASLRVTGAAKYSDACQVLLERLFAGFGERVSVNLYMSGGEGLHGLPLHYDDHEVFALQVSGTKRWQLWAPEINRAVVPFPEFTGDKPDPTQRPPDLEFKLAAGDALYVPRGFWHRAVCENGHSVHLTCGVHAKRAIDLLSWMFDEALKSEQMRTNLPLCPDRWDPKPLLTATEAAIAQLRDALDTPDAVQRFLRARMKFEHERTFTFDGRT
jgi:ribosomal protein L16 Arg81 hydroxylase